MSWCCFPGNDLSELQNTEAPPRRLQLSPDTDNWLHILPPAHRIWYARPHAHICSQTLVHTLINTYTITHTHTHTLWRADTQTDNYYWLIVSCKLTYVCVCVCVYVFFCRWSETTVRFSQRPRPEEVTQEEEPSREGIQEEEPTMVSMGMTGGLKDKPVATHTHTHSWEIGQLIVK